MPNHCRGKRDVEAAAALEWCGNRRRRRKRPCGGCRRGVVVVVVVERGVVCCGGGCIVVVVVFTLMHLNLRPSFSQCAVVVRQMHWV